MNEIELQELYLNYKENISPKKSLDKLHQIIYKYATLRFKQDSDTSSEFYLFIYDKINNIFQEYDPSYNISFLTFLSVKLKNHYYNYLRAYKKNTESECLMFEWEENTLLKPAFENESSSLNKNENLITSIQYGLSTLIIDEDIILRLYFGFYLKLTHFRHLLKLHQNFHFFHLYKQYLKKLHTQNKKNKEKKETLIEKLQSFDFTDSTMSEEKRKNLKDRFIKELFSVSFSISLNDIAKIMCSNISFVYRRLKKGLQNFKHYILEVKELFYTV